MFRARPRNPPVVQNNYDPVPLAAQAAGIAATVPAEVAALRLASRTRDLVEKEVREGDASELCEELLTYALSRVDWLQFAQAQIEAAAPEALEDAA